MTPTDGGEGLGPGIAQAWQKNEPYKAIEGDKWAVVGSLETKFLCIYVILSLSAEQIILARL